MTIQTPIIGIDVAKENLSLYRLDTQQSATLANDRRAIVAWLKTLPADCAVAIEATSTYHVLLADLAYQCGHRIYVIDGYRLSNYRKGIGGRAKTDQSDARLLARYLAHEQNQLHPWNPACKAYRRLQLLLRRRATLVRSATALRLSFAQDRQMARELKPVLERIKRLERRLNEQVHKALQEAGLAEQAKRCQAIEGIGPLTAAALNLAFLRGSFRNSDAFIAFLGLDVRVKESGRHSGRRKLSKQGDSEIRRLLHNAAMAASRTTAWQQRYQQYLQRGLKRTEALVILARKLARIAFALMKTQQPYRPAVDTVG
ncbi:transposase [Pseudomonas sp. SK3(2021)]|uniref:IS110 family transposase n=1 Tax=Pseudomonas sp. SK3(2021) TaxID=2841064 RepID=UPI00192BBEF7|nr:transposase [Pseudomonas sp. SK3(2021)]QQZ44350.1 transposase [Pseudomonas sp. SK3(2021)]